MDNLSKAYSKSLFIFNQENIIYFTGE